MAVKKVVDTWKTKSWYSVHAPKFLNEVEVAQIPAQDDEHILNRIVKVPLKDITKDLSHVYTTVKLRVSEVKGKAAYAKFIGHEVSREYLHALVRRRMDALNAVFSVVSKDGVEFRIKAVVLTAYGCSGSQKTALRNALMRDLKKRAQAKPFGEFIYETLFGKTAAEVFKSLRSIAPLKRVEIRKTELKEVFDTPELQKLPKEVAEEEAKKAAAAKAEAQGDASMTESAVEASEAEKEAPDSESDEEQSPTATSA